MKIFIISYDLHDGNQEEYKKIDEELTRLGGKRLLESTWLLNRADNWTPDSVLEHLLRFTNARHNIIVCEIRQQMGIPVMICI